MEMLGNLLQWFGVFMSLFVGSMCVGAGLYIGMIAAGNHFGPIRVVTRYTRDAQP